MDQIVQFFVKNKEQLAHFNGESCNNKPCKISVSRFLEIIDSPFIGSFYISINFLIIMILFLFIESCGTSENDYYPKAENIKKGEILFKADGCFACHSITNEVKYGPALNNILNTKINVIGKSGQYSIMVDREYILRSIKDPAFEKMVGFQNKKMIQPAISEEDINLLADYIISINLKQTVK